LRDFAGFHSITLPDYLIVSFVDDGSKSERDTIAATSKSTNTPGNALLRNVGVEPHYTVFISGAGHVRLTTDDPFSWPRRVQDLGLRKAH
jgi:hypothetical protein